MGRECLKLGQRQGDSYAFLCDFRNCGTDRLLEIREVFAIGYNNKRYHESLDTLTPADVYYGRTEEVITRREQIKQETLEKRRQRRRQEVTDTLYLENESSLTLTTEMSR